MPSRMLDMVGVCIRIPTIIAAGEAPVRRGRRRSIAVNPAGYPPLVVGATSRKERNSRLLTCGYLKPSLSVR